MTGKSMSASHTPRVFYGWWIVAAAFINLFFAVGIIFYGFPVFYPAFVTALGFTRAQVTQGFLLGFLVVGLPFGLLAGTLIDRIGARWVILAGVAFIGLPLIAMGSIVRFWQYELLCVLEVIGYVLAGPIANQVLIAQWFQAQRGRAMGYAYLGLGLGGAVAPVSINWLLRTFGWRHALEIVGTVILAVLFPVGILVTRSVPGEVGLYPDGAASSSGAVAGTQGTTSFRVVRAALGDRNFWLITLGSALVIGAMNAVIQHFIFFLEGRGYSAGTASRFLSVLLLASLGGRVIVGHLADHFRKKNTMACFYCLLGAAIPLLHIAQHPLPALSFAVIFGFSMGADYMLIPLVTAECFGVGSLGKILALIIMAYSVGQWVGPWAAGWIFDTMHSYDRSWTTMTCAALLGSALIYTITGPRRDLQF